MLDVWNFLENMDLSDPQILYMVLILPSLFGLTLVGEGLQRVIKSDFDGWLSLIIGMVFIVLVILGYIYLSKLQTI